MLEACAWLLKQLGACLSRQRRTEMEEQDARAALTLPCLPGSVGISETQKQQPTPFKGGLWGCCCCSRGEKLELLHGKHWGQTAQQQGGPCYGLASP